jgi:DNA-binding response OmpR family regulator
LEAIENTNFDFIITDIQMPNMDGFLFIEKLKSAHYSTFNNQPIVALTGRTDLDYSFFTEAGFTTVIKKPYSPKVLLETIQNVLENNTVPAVDMNTVEEIRLSKQYSLESLKQFVGDDKEALHEVLTQFVESSEENMVFLEKAVKDKDTTEINSIAHRIAPMFRQIESHDIDGILRTLEMNNFENTDLDYLFDSLKTKMDLLFTALKEEMV